MHYKTLYRKYRPKNFDEIVGQKAPTKILKNSIIKNQIAHAYLFFGVRGTGKTSLAKIFARSINCENSTDGNPCEKCESCKLTINNYIDIVEIDAASNNGVDEIRELNDDVKYLPTSLKYKVYIVDEVHMLSESAFNALLKTLEEPPEHIVFILATTEYSKLPKTIVSRCQVLEFKKIDDLSMIEKLKSIAKKEKIKVDDEALKEICFYSGGGLRDAIGFLEKANSYESDRITIETIREMFNSVSDTDILNILNLIDENNPEKLLVKIKELFDNGVEAMILANSILYYLRKEVVENKKYSKDNYERILIFDDLIKKIKISEHPNIIFEITLLNMINYEQINVQNEFVEVEEIEVDFNEELKDIRVNNTLCAPDRNIIMEVRKQWGNLKNLTDCDENLLKILYYDVKPVAASTNNIILMTKGLGIAAKVNNNIEDIEQMYYNVFKKKHKLICISEKEWDIYKNKYEQDKDSFVYVEEDDKKIKKDNLSNKVNKLLGKKYEGE